MPPPSNVSNIQPPEALNPIAAKGFATGAFRFGSISIITHLLLRAYHPIYRGLTVQFMVFMQLSAMTLGGCIFAEKRVSEFNDMVRRRNRALERSNRAWNDEQEMRAAMESRQMEANAATEKVVTKTPAEA